MLVSSIWKQVYYVYYLSTNQLENFLKMFVVKFIFYIYMDVYFHI